MHLSVNIIMVYLRKQIINVHFMLHFNKVSLGGGEGQNFTRGLAFI